MAASLQPDPLLLASRSPRRAQLLREAEYRFEVDVPPLREPTTQHAHVDPASFAESLAFFKASGLAPRHPGKTILAADTIAVVEGEIIGKPADRDDAKRILTRMSGTTHSVITGIVLLQPETGHRLLQHGRSTVRVKALSQRQIEAYLDTGQWQGKAGAYGIQDHGDPFVEHVAGSFTNVVGLPMELLAEMFADWQR